jgi:hypothetical protein
MKSRILILVVALITTGAYAQIPNGGFESWTSVDPDSWATSNAAPVYTNVVKSATAHSGSISARGDVIALGPGTIQPVLQSGAGGLGTPVSTRYAAVTGWYQLTAVGNDRMSCNFNLFKNGVPIATGATLLPAAASWTQFNVPFGYYGAGVPDTCILQIMIVRSGGGSPSVGSWFLVDDLSLTGVNAVEEAATPLRFSLEQNFPNPFNPTTVVTYQLPIAAQVRLSIYNLLGQEIAVLVNGQKTPGTHEATFDAANHPSGMYLYRLQAGSYVQTRTMILVR